MFEEGTATPTALEAVVAHNPTPATPEAHAKGLERFKKQLEPLQGKEMIATNVVTDTVADSEMQPDVPSSALKGLKFDGPGSRGRQKNRHNVPVVRKMRKRKNSYHALAATEESSASDYHTDDEEREWVHRLSGLWVEKGIATSSVADCKTELQRKKNEISEQLSEFAKLLKNRGKMGRWASFLRDAKIPLSTADRWVKAHRLRVGELMEEPAKEIPSKLTPRQLDALVNKVVGKLKVTLTDADDCAVFLERFTLVAMAELPVGRAPFNV